MDGYYIIYKIHTIHRGTEFHSEIFLFLLKTFIVNNRNVNTLWTKHVLVEDDLLRYIYVVISFRRCRVYNYACFQTLIITCSNSDKPVPSQVSTRTVASTSNSPTRFTRTSMAPFASDTSPSFITERDTVTTAVDRNKQSDYSCQA